MRRFAGVWIVLLGLLSSAIARAASPGDATTVTLWHSYRADEERGLRAAADLAEKELGIHVELLAVPFDAYFSTRPTAVPSSHGPDVVIDAHERLGAAKRERLVAPVGAAMDGLALDLPPALAHATEIDGVPFGVPLALKALALYINPRLLASPPSSIAELASMHFGRGVYPLAYDAENVYFHAAFLHGFGGQALVVDREGAHYGFDSPAGVRSVEFVRDLLARGVVPLEPSGALVTSLFVEGRAAAVIGGPPLAAELGDAPYRVAPLPKAEPASAGPLRSFVTVEAAMLTPGGAKKPSAVRLAHFLADRPASIVRATVGHQVVANAAAWSEPALASDPNLKAFREAALAGVPMSTSAAMRAVWDPTLRALKKALRGDVDAKTALDEARRRFEDALRPAPPPAQKTGWLVLVGLLLLAACAWMVTRARAMIREGEAREVRRLLPWTAPAAIAVLALVVLPLAVGAVTSFYAGTRSEPYFVGLANYRDILTARGGPLFGADSFYRTLAVTVLWTVVNLAIHVSAGLLLGTLLARPVLRLRPLYRVLLVVPWAIPSYVTALVWKGMFHRQFGAVNALLALVGAPPVSWFSKFATAFTANVVTNAWLGFPFMMVVVSGALSSMDRSLLEAAEVDGATRWQKFRWVTLPLVLPSIAPAVALGAVWTFNMFNVVYLVSGGEPDGSTDILVSEAYRWAFTREAQMGYATAYAVLIFVLLFAFARRTKSLDVEELR
jgi:arabinogalactan oligomer/maltooligosaccharide transport system permease protein